MRPRTAGGAMLICAVMVLMIGAPLATADTHHVVKGLQGPRESAVTWTYVPESNGRWYGHIVNSGLKSLVIEVDDNTTGVPSTVLHEKIRFAGYSTNTQDTEAVLMTKDRIYSVTATPTGPKGKSCTVEDLFTTFPPLFASFNYTVIGSTIYADGSASHDAAGAIVAWGWDWGDGTTGTAMISSHTYTEDGTYTIVLTVMDAYGVTASASQDVTVVEDS